jgi:glycerophosphoryl diester phosphodiesterase
MRWWRSVADPFRRPDWLTARPYAHRGLHGPGIIENSRAAFEAAIAAGFGIELDVRADACGTPFVFHDPDLKRLCGVDARLQDLDAKSTGGIRLLNTNETIPSLSEILSLVAGQVPLLIEVKSKDGPRARFRGALLAALRAYHGPAAVMSFDPRTIAWFARHAPERPRGLVVSEQGMNRIKGLIERHLAVGFARPDFLAYDVRSLPSPFAARFRRVRPVLTWTVRTAEQERIARDNADQIIHELPQ